MTPVSRFVRSASKLVTGSVGAQVISVATAALLGRLFVPSAVGEYYLILSVATMVALVSTGRYELAMIGVLGPRTALALSRVSMILNGATLLLLCFCLLVFDFLSSYRPLLDWDFEWPLGALLAFHLGVHQILMAYANRCGKFGSMARARVLAALCNFAAVAVGAMYSRAAEVLVIANITSILGAIAYLQWTLRNDWAKPVRMGTRRYVAILVRHWKFPTYGVLGGLLNSLVYTAPLFLLSIIYGSAVSGSFAMAQRIVSLPMNLVTNAAAEVFRADVRSAVAPAGVERVYRRTLKILTAGAVPIAVIGVLTGPIVITLILGQRWEVAGTYATLLIPMYAIRFVGSPLGYMPIFYGRIDLEFFFQLSWTVVLAGLLFATASALPAIFSIATYAAVNFFAFLLYILWSWSLVRKRSRVRFSPTRDQLPL